MTVKLQTSATLRKDSLYVPRPEDELFLAAASEPRSWLNVYGCRTMGKSSLCARYEATLAAKGIKTIFIDVAARVGTEHRTASEWFRALAEAWTSSLGLGYDLVDDALEGLRGNDPGMTAERLLSRALLRQCSGNVLLVLDEYDYIAEVPYRDDILFAFRHIQNVQARTTLFDRLSICLVGLQEIVSFGRAGAANTSPLCEIVEMRDFKSSPQTLRALSSAFPDDPPDEKVLVRLLELSGGQPQVTMHLLSAIAPIRAGVRKCCSTPAEVQAIADDLVAPSGLGRDLSLFATIEKAMSEGDSSMFAALSAYKSLLKGGNESSLELKILLPYGLLRQTGERLESKGGLFRRRFDDAWAGRMLDRIAGGRSMQQYRGRTKGSRKRICVINAGGTLGMVERGEQIVPPRDAEEFRGYFTSLDSIAQTEFINLFPPRDSINVFPDQWITIARYIFARRHDAFDGFVVAHGTDTMAYTASAVAFALGPNLGFPVVFTGAQTTPDVAYGDAHVNLYRACEVAKKPIHEVVISFGNFVYRAVRAQKKDDRRFDGFESPTYPPLAEITGEINVRTELLREAPTGGDIKLRAEFERSILLVPQFPGLEPGFFSHLLGDAEGGRPCKGVIVQTLGAGNVASEMPYSFIPFVQRAYRRGIPVIVTSQYPPDPGTHTKYTPAQAPLAAGAIHAGNMTLAAAVTKFRWVLAHVRRRKGWPKMSPQTRKELVTELMVAKALIGEF